MGPLQDSLSEIPRVNAAAILQPFQGKLLPDKVPCRAGCLHSFCSAACEADAWSVGHGLFCEETSSRDPESALVKLLASKLYRRSQTFRLSIMVLAEAVARHRSRKPGKGEGEGLADEGRVKQSDESGMRGNIRSCSYESILDNYYGSITQEEASITRQGSLSTLKLLVDAWHLSTEEYRMLVDAWPNIVSRIVLNAQEIRVEAPLKAILVNAANAIDKEQRGCCEGDDNLEDVVATALQSVSLNDQRGTGLFKVHAKLNHACTGVANVRVVSRSGDPIGVSVKALRDISNGEELMFDYLGEACPVCPERSVMLLEKYGFMCQCGACDDTEMPPADRRKLFDR